MLRDNIRPGSSDSGLTQDVNGILLFYDNSRSKNLSVTRESLTYGVDHKNISGDRWLQLTGQIPTNILGYKVPRNGTITAITVQTQNIATCNFYIRKNNSVTNIYTSSLVGVSNKVDDNLNVDINQGDFLQTLLSVGGGVVDYPILLLEIAWR